MSYNLVDPTTGDLTRVAGGIDTSIIPSNASASNKLATIDKVVKDSRTAVITLYNNSTGAFLETDMNLTAPRSGILKVSFNKKETGNTLNIYINDIRKYEYPNWWGENVYETAYVPVNNGDEIRISTDVSDGGDYYRIVNVSII